ncbi:hypothetical protein GGU10DRAFT_336273 [Lentinula aff. detonsa]|uniref:Uncharacterized protein n=1 Tax=Lentinula aff. detonsa TaxID=2804958 RepID=A0AA38NBL8_9AGAR|nr:hypothetical protein GGU10DRAFT_336273 [Lentinula aff. detonsa]
MEPRDKARALLIVVLRLLFVISIETEPVELNTTHLHSPKTLWNLTGTVLTLERIMIEVPEAPDEVPSVGGGCDTRRYSKGLHGPWKYDGTSAKLSATLPTRYLGVPAKCKEERSSGASDRTDQSIRT